MFIRLEAYARDVFESGKVLAAKQINVLTSVWQLKNNNNMLIEQAQTYFGRGHSLHVLCPLVINRVRLRGQSGLD